MCECTCVSDGERERDGGRGEAEEEGKREISQREQYILDVSGWWRRLVMMRKEGTSSTVNTGDHDFYS